MHLQQNILILTARKMTGSEYNLLSSVRDQAESTNSEDTIQPTQYNPDVIRSQLTNQISTSKENVAIMGNESVQASGLSIREEQTTADDKGSCISLSGKVFETDMLQDVVASLRVVKSVPPPPIPLCRLVVNEAIRTVQENITDLGMKFRTMGYPRELGTFFVSMKRVGESELEVD
ncbi:hypothetical protein O6H91_14G032300 [Diphasiastrum complanatum]|uniref:Uncharacterized protein n=1 Tax=Diphasiastrum complanatum TaxID=34168 RepID=A0ACC2BMU9_DIPCM|nr:hypothetical protein O6H91_14G032300 [Diphasiastrum complanatum]